VLRIDAAAGADTHELPNDENKIAKAKLMQLNQRDRFCHPDNAAADGDGLA
jgi:hypothetical protein